MGESVEPFVMPSARAAAMGGNHVAYADDFYAIFTNPAAFVDIEEEFSVAELSLCAYGPVFEIVDFLQDVLYESKTLDISSILGPRGFAAGFDLGGPIALGWIGRGWALGFFNRTRFDTPITGTALRPQISEDTLLAGGYSFRLLNQQRHYLDLGFLGKGFYRGALKMDASMFDINTLLKEPSAYPFITYLGIGFDVGLRYSFGDNFSAALVCYDAYSPAVVSSYSSFSDFRSRKKALGVDYSLVKTRLDFGLKYRIHPSFLSRYISHLVIAADYRDFTDLFALIPRNPILNLGIGMEMVLLKVLSIRAGVTDALPSVGFGLDLSFMRLDCSMYGKELGFDPGIQSTYAVALGLLFRY
ncbi:MAG: hypothetical protein LBT93_02585 [Treponema sp.]|nr:hypothetical protein [Treponema sp.]